MTLALGDEELGDIRIAAQDRSFGCLASQQLGTSDEEIECALGPPTGEARNPIEHADDAIAPLLEGSRPLG